MMAQQEALGDLKLYRIPEPVTVAAHSQKQVALLERADVRVRIVYRQRLVPTGSNVVGPTQRFLITRNRATEGLGLPLPAGRLMLFSEGGGRPILVGQGTMTDNAVGDEVEIGLGPSPRVQTHLVPRAVAKGRDQYELTVSNDHAEPILFEAEIASGDLVFDGPRRLARRNGMSLWSVTVPGNGTATLRYTLTRARPRR